MRLRTGLFALVIACRLWAGPDAPQTAGPLSLEDCVRLALEAPSPATLAEHGVAIAREQGTIAKSGFLPYVRVGSGFVYNSPLLEQRDQFSFVALNGIREYLMVVDSTWEVDLSGRLRAGLAVARAQRSLAEADRRLARRDLRRAVAVAYYDVLLTRHLEELEGDALEEARDFERRTRALQAQGEASMADVYKAAAQSARFAQRLSQARMNARLANQVLASYWTDDVDRRLELEDTLDRPPPLPAELSAPPGVVPALVQRRPELLRFDALEQQFHAEERAAKAGLRPQANLVFQYGLDSNYVRWANRGYAAFVALDIPVFDWFRSRGAARQARYRAEQIAQQRAIAARTFSREYYAAKARAESWFERIAAARDEVRSARENLRLARLLYEGGEGLALDVVTAQTQVADAGTAYYTAIAGYLKALVDFEVASGK